MFDKLKKFTSRSLSVAHPTGALKDETLLAFKATASPYCGSIKNGTLEMTFGDAAMNILITGGTGTGKTSGICCPALHILLSRGCPGIVLDVKGDYAALVREEFKDRAMILGPADDAEPINLLSGYNSEMLGSFLRTLKTRHHDSYWGSSGIVDAMMIFEFVAVSQNREPTLKDVFKYLTDPRSFCGDLSLYLKSLSGNVSSSHAKLFAMIRARESDGADNFGILKVGGFKSKDPKKFDLSDTQRQQYSWQTNAIVNAISPICTNPRLIEKFCPERAYCMDKIIYEERKSIVLEMDANEYGDTAFMVSKMLRERFRATVLKHDPKDRAAKKFGIDVFSFMLIDEYQAYLSTGEDDNSADDNNWFDRSRSYGHINVVATQSINSMLAKASNKNAVRTIVQNCRNFVALSTTDEETLSYVNLLANADLRGETATSVKRLIHSKVRGTAFAYIGNSSRSSGASVCADVVTGHLSSFPHMGKYFSARTHSAFSGLSDEVVESGIPNPFYESPPAREAWEKKIGGIFIKRQDLYRLFVWYSIHGVSFDLDLIERIWQHFDIFDGLKLSQLKAELPFNDLLLDSEDSLAKFIERPQEERPKRSEPKVFVFSPRNAKGFHDFCETFGGEVIHVPTNSGKHGKRALIEAFLQVDFIDGDVAVVVRGGGDVTSSQFDTYNDQSSVEAIKFLRSWGVTVFVGVGHKGDDFLVDSVADHVAITPSQAGVEAKQFLETRGATSLQPTSALNLGPVKSPVQICIERIERFEADDSDGLRAKSFEEILAEERRQFEALGEEVDFTASEETKSSIEIVDEALQQLRADFDAEFGHEFSKPEASVVLEAEAGLDEEGVMTNVDLVQFFENESVDIDDSHHAAKEVTVTGGEFKFNDVVGELSSSINDLLKKSENTKRTKYG